MVTVDLSDKLAAARAEATGEPRTLRVFDLELVVPEINALALADAFRYPAFEQTSRVVEALFGSEQYAALIRANLNDAQLGIVLEAAMGLLGVTLGESTASGASSGNGSKRSRPISRASTG